MARWVKAKDRIYMFKRATEPVVADGLTVGDLWLDTTSGAIAKICTSVSPVTFETVDVGTGDIVGPGSSTDNALIRFDGTDGKLGQNSGVLVSDTNDITGVNSVNKVALTAPATSATLTIADGKTLTASNTLTFSGTDSSSIAFGTGGTVSYLIAATQTDQETGTSTTLTVTPGRQQFHASAVKCWGQITNTAGTLALASSYNVTSISDDSIGVATVTIATDFSSANYVVVTGMQRSSGEASIDWATKAAGSFIMRGYTALEAADDNNMDFVCLGDQ